MVGWWFDSFSTLIVMLRLDRKTQHSLLHSASLPKAENHIPISIVKPVYGADKYTADNFRSWIKQDYTEKTQLIFSFQNVDDEAVPIARLAASNAEIEITIPEGI